MKRITVLFLISLVFSIIIFDLVALFFLGGLHSTVSWVLWSYSREYPVIAFVVGFICGHIWFPVTGGLTLHPDEKEQAQDKPYP